MRILHIAATGVHGYLDLNVKFFPDVTFLFGLNGSGKTTVLRLVSALLAPKLEELYAIEFAGVVVAIEHNGKIIEVSATRAPGEIELGISSESLLQRISDSELQHLIEFRRHDGARSPIVDKLASHPVTKAISELPTPIFLGLDRRFVAPWLTKEEDDRVREAALRKARFADSPFRSGALGVAEASHLLLVRANEIKSKQELLDKALRDQILRSAFAYNPIRLPSTEAIPTIDEMNRVSSRVDELEIAADGLRIPHPEIAGAIDAFVQKMRNLVAKFQRAYGERKPDLSAIYDWFTHGPQAERILSLIEVLNKYLADRAQAESPLSRFISTLNAYLVQTGKRIDVGGSGDLQLQIDGYPGTPTIAALSSGERQMLVMLAFLSLSPGLESSGVLMIDEPELSLHIDWQERFAQSLLEVNENFQFILATHSPAIVRNRADRMVRIAIRRPHDYR